jgi:hypothetical protein
LLISKRPRVLKTNRAVLKPTALPNGIEVAQFAGTRGQFFKEDRHGK